MPKKLPFERDRETHAALVYLCKRLVWFMHGSEGIKKVIRIFLFRAEEGN